MLSIDDILQLFRVPPDKRVKLKNYDPGWEGDEKKFSRDMRKQRAAAMLAESVEELAKAQELLYAADSWSVLMIFQAMDAAGKDSTIKHVMSGINPQGCQVFSFKHPSAEDLDHDFLWRCMKCLPERGRIGIFNRSYYEEVLIVRVHPQLALSQRIPGVGANDIDGKLWERRYTDINNFEEHLTHNGTAILKFFLHVSKDEQRKRFLKRIKEPSKLWKFSPRDVAEREHWDDYMKAYEDALSATSTSWAPWYVIPADHKWVTRALVSQIVVHTIKSLDMKYPQHGPESLREIEECRKKLEDERA